MRRGKGSPWCAKCGKGKGTGRYGKTYCIPCATRMGSGGSTSDYRPLSMRGDGPRANRGARIYRGKS